MKKRKIAVFVRNLRKESYNLKTARAQISPAPLNKLIEKVAIEQ